MKIIDLLNKITNGEKFPKKIKYQGDIYEYDENIKIFYNEEENMELMEFIHEYDLKENIEIIEEPKELEKITWNEKSKWNGNSLNDTEMLMSRTEQLKKSLNEIIEKLGEINE